MKKCDSIFACILQRRIGTKRQRSLKKQTKLKLNQKRLQFASELKYLNMHPSCLVPTIQACAWWCYDLGLVRSRLSPKEIRTADYLGILNHQVCSDFFPPSRWHRHSPRWWCQDLNCKGLVQRAWDIIFNPTENLWDVLEKTWLPDH